jgi:RNA polymerase-binding transcription factor DksA
MIEKPSDAEKEYFARVEMQKRLEAQVQRAAAKAHEERKRLKELHYMHCPKCGAELHEEELEGVSVDICPSCRGIFLDDGELSKLIERPKGLLGQVRALFQAEK